jgi:IMP cyclohydrolase-like protein
VDSNRALSNSAYSGRGIAICHSKRDGLGVIYWISGRSPASKRRALVPDDVGLRVVDLEGLDDDSLRHYRAARSEDHFEVVGNGDHLDQMSFALSRGVSIASVFERLEPEPDQIGTPRLAAVLEQRTRLITIGGARPRSAGSGSELHLLGPTAIEVGKGLLIATYMGNPKSPSPWSEPQWIEVVDSFEDQMEGLWSALGDDYRIAIAGKLAGPGASWQVRE